MKLIGLETFVVANPPPHFGGRWFLFLRLTTDDGITGVGECYASSFAPTVLEAAIRDLFERWLLDREPDRIEAFMRASFHGGYTGRPDPTVQGAASALEMACWDIVGKALDRPVHRLLGGAVHERLRTYSYLYPEADDVGDVYADPELAAQRAARYVERGFTAVKFDPAGPYGRLDPRQPSLADLDRCERFCRLLREAVGDRADLLFGTHGQFTASGALRVAERIRSAAPLWFEEPVPPTEEASMARVVADAGMPVAAGERLTTMHEFSRLLACGVDIVQPNLGRAGGILEGRKIAVLAEASGAQLAPHLYCGPIVAAANVQLALCSPNFLVLEGIGDFGGFHAEVLREGLRWEQGWLLPPTEPGLGVELDDAVCAANRYEGTALNLSVAEDAPVP